MKLPYIGLLLFAGLLSGCFTSAKYGEYDFGVRNVEKGRAEISGYFHASASVTWRKTIYGDEPKALVQLLITSLLPDVAPASYEINNIGFTRYESGGNYIGWSAVVTGGEEIISRLQSKVGKRIEGDFSLEEVRLLPVRNERALPPNHPPAPATSGHGPS